VKILKAVSQEGREGKGREGKGREGKGREGKGREGKGSTCTSFDESLYYFRKTGARGNDQKSRSVLPE
jgi:hypothetical protein